MAAAVELGLKKKTAILAKALPQINAARGEGFSHAQIYQAILAGGLKLTPAYYENLYARESRKEAARQTVKAGREADPSEDQSGDEEDGQQSNDKREGFSSSADELRRARAVSRQDFSKLIKRRKP